MINAKQNLEWLKEQWNLRETKKIECPVPIIDWLFPKMFLGELYMLFAPTGTGKSTFLFATAKKYAEKGNVLFVTREETIIDLVPYMDSNIAEGLFLSEQYNVQDIKDNNIHYVFFDYIGSNGDFSWDALKETTTQLTQDALENDFLLFTAGQADNKLRSVAFDPEDYTKYTAEYISFSKHMLDKCAGAFYIVRQGNEETLRILPIKYRHGPLSNQMIDETGLDFSRREWK